MNNETKHNQGTVLAQKHFFLSESFFCRVFALCILLTLSLLPITAQTNTQQSTPDYIIQAEASVKKYYPQYEEYFKTICKEIYILDKEYINVINNNLDKIAKNTKIGTSEKDIYTTILMTLEKLTGENTFCNDDDIAKNIEEKHFKEGAAEAIVRSIKKGLEKRKNELEIIMKKWREMAERMRTIGNKNNLTREDDEELLNIVEDMYNLIENTEAIKDKRNKPIFREYLSRCKDIGRVPKKEIVEWVKKNQE